MKKKERRSPLLETDSGQIDKPAVWELNPAVWLSFKIYSYLFIYF